MSTQGQKTETALTFRKYKEGDTKRLPWKEEIFQASWSYKCPTYIHRTPPCQGSCPAGEDIRGWLGIVRGMEKPPAGMDWQEYAFMRSTNANPFPSVMGRVCPAPCQTGCNRNMVEDFVGINAVEQFIGDTALAKGYKLVPPGEDTGKKVAIIGGGPAGLAAAYQLRRRGHACTVFDDHAELGGMMMYGIPGYRTPRDMLKGEIQRILDMGVETRLNMRVGRDISITQLEKEFDAVLWAIGCKSGRPLPVPGADAPNCVSGVDFLSEFNQQKLHHVPKRVVVVGGGDTSIDVASVARRLGYNHVVAEQVKDFGRDSAADGGLGFGYVAHDVAHLGAREGAQVTLTSLFTTENMTAAQHEVQDALREGVDIHAGVMPTEVVLNEQGRATGLKMIKCTVDKRGIPSPVAGAEPYVIEADVIVSAIGQYGDLTQGLEELNNGRGFIEADSFFQVKGRPGHFAAGDIIRPHLLTTAIGQAAVAVDTIDRYLQGSELSKRPKVDVHHFNLLAKLHETALAPEDFIPEEQSDLRGTADAKYAVHNYEDRAAHEVISYDDLFLAHFPYTARNLREDIPVAAEEVLGHFGERMKGLSTDQAQTEAKRCMSCGLCFECDNCVMFCPQEAVKRTPKKEATTGRYVYTDYSRCIGCHICADVCPTGYINMGLGE
ncbi:protein involved in sulfur oxidation DsrL [Thioploca ingrica]|uniref:Protein involved in sulfur oxidation DsrL n=1 Tax=Thioploca ingrica TaxID=40754 RepID=A0A090BUD5_9GAMM|nr:protein involved in sulfur oxidation DsrL [Thioploca ingrica]